jgi:hypothetical protein
MGPVLKRHLHWTFSKGDSGFSTRIDSYYLHRLVKRRVAQGGRLTEVDMLY